MNSDLEILRVACILRPLFHVSSVIRRDSPERKTPENLEPFGSRIKVLFWERINHPSCSRIDTG